MTGGRKPHLGGVVAFARAEHDRADDLLGAVVPARMREEPPARAASVLANVVPFARPRSNDNARPVGPELAFPAATRPAPMAGRSFGVTRRAGFIAMSLLVHGAVFAALWREPAPMNGTELEAISVELVPPGNNTPAGRSPTASENEGVAQAGQVTEAPDEKPPVEQAEQPTTDQPQDVKVAEQEAAREQPVVAEQQTPPEPVLAPQEPESPREVVQQPTPAPKEPEPRESIAMVESPNPPEIATEKPPEVAPEKPVEPERLTLLPQAPPPEEKPAEPPKPELEPQKPVLRDPEPQKQSEPKKPEPKKPEAKKQQAKEKPKAKEATRIAARTAERTIERSAGPQSIVGSNGTGIGAAARASYSGIVAAHLRRFKQYPSDAQARGEEGTALLSFALDGGGRLTSVRLVRSSGVPSLDQAAQAWVRRASPFPPPPNPGHVVTAPLNFNIR
jgi:protein TonB